MSFLFTQRPNGYCMIKTAKITACIDKLPAQFASLKVLVVDDEPFMLDIVEEVLGQLDIKNVICAESSSQALEHIKSSPEAVGLMICDLSMPGMDGIECMRHLADLQFKGGIIILSGSDKRLLDSVGDLLLEHNLNFLGALEKPVTKAAMAAVIARLSDSTFKSSGNYSGLQMLTPSEIRAGLKGDSVQVAFQPKVTVTGRRMVGAECLLRWQDPKRGLVPPMAVIPVAEKYGLIDELSMKVFAKAIEHMGEWARQGHELKISINFSMDNLKRYDLPDQLSDIALKAGIKPNQIVLEITETRLMSDLATGLEIITRLRLMGFGLSIDDFGTGYASMEKLKQMPFTELKVDRAFVFGSTDNPVARAILESSVKLGHALGLVVVAEGAETQEDWDMVVTQGCDQLQGYVVAKPMPADELIGWMMQWEQ